MNVELMNVMGTLQNTMDTFLSRETSNFKASKIRMHLRAAFEWALIERFDKALDEINIAEKMMQ